MLSKLATFSITSRNKKMLSTPKEPSQKQCSKSCRPVGRDADQELDERKETGWDMMITTFLGTRPCGKEAVVASSLG